MSRSPANANSHRGIPGAKGFVGSPGAKCAIYIWLIFRLLDVRYTLEPTSSCWLLWSAMMSWKVQVYKTENKESFSNIVEEPQGIERVRHETTAAYAQAEAPNSRVAHEVEENAEHVQQAAARAALAAQGMGSDLTGESNTSTAFDVLKSATAQKTNAAALEGQSDVHMAEDASARYLDQAKTMVESIFTSAQGYLHGSKNPQGPVKQPVGSSTGITSLSSPGTGGYIISSLETSASSAVGTAQQYLASAQAAAQPQVDKARETAEGYLGMHSGTSPSDAVTPPSTTRPTTGAPLSGEDVAGTPHASSKTTPGADERELESNVA